MWILIKTNFKASADVKAFGSFYIDYAGWGLEEERAFRKKLRRSSAKITVRECSFSSSGAAQIEVIKVLFGVPRDVPAESDPS